MELNSEVRCLEDAVFCGYNKVKSLLSDWEILGSRVTKLEVLLMKYSRLSDKTERESLMTGEIKPLYESVKTEIDRLQKEY